MESKEQYTESPPSYAFPLSSQYPTDAAPSPSAPGQTPYPPPASQEYPGPSQQYLPAAGQAPYGQAYGYGQPYAGYPGQPMYVAPQYVGAPSQHEPQRVVVVSAVQQPMTVHQVQSYVGHIIFACVVFWLCNCLFGLIAFILASQYTLCLPLFLLLADYIAFIRYDGEMTKVKEVRKSHRKLL